MYPFCDRARLGAEGMEMNKNGQQFAKFASSLIQVKALSLLGIFILLLTARNICG